MNLPLPAAPPLVRASLLLTLALAACSEPATAPLPVAGEVEVVLVSPNGAEGAAVIGLPASRVRGIVGPADGLTYVVGMGDRLRVVVILGTPGTIRFTLVADDVEAPLGADLVEVSGPDDALRPSLAGYAVTAVRSAP